MDFVANFAGILLGGLSAGTVLFIVSVGLSVTMGLMGFVNLAHGAFAMFGGYVIVLSMNRAHFGFAAALALGFVATAAISVVLERTLYRRLYRASELDQVLFTIGLIFIFIAGAIIVVGPESQTLQLPAALRGQINLGFLQYRTYSIFLIVIGFLIGLGISLAFERTRIGAQIRATVDNRRMAELLGINVDRLFTITFAFGSGMAGIGGGLGAEFLGLDPQYALKYLVYFLIAVSVGGLGSVMGVYYASLILGRARFRAETLSAQGRHHFHLCAHHPAAAVAAARIVRQERDVSAAAPTATDHPGARGLITRHRLRWWEALPWIIGLGFYFAFPDYLGFGAELLAMILFALSLDLALGYAGIITLGHAAFFGAGAYTVGMLAFYEIWTEPITSLLLAALVAAIIGFLSGLVLLRTRGLTLLMLTLCTMALLQEAANMARAYTGGFDGLPDLAIAPVFGVFEFNPLYANTQYLYSLGVLLVCFIFVRTLIYSPFGQSLTGIRENLLRMHAIGSPVRLRLVICYTISAALAGIAGGLWAQTNAFVNLSALDLDRAATVFIVLILGGYGRLYGAFVGAVVYLALEHFLAKIYPTAWQLGLGLLLVMIALFARNGILGIGEALWQRYSARRKTP